MNNITNLEKPIISRVEYILIFSLIYLSGNPTGGILGESRYLIAALLMLFYWSSKSKGQFSPSFKKWMIGFGVLFVFQMLTIEIFSFPAYVNFFARFLLVFLIVVSLGEKFRYGYTRIMYYIALISLPLFALNYIGVEFNGYKIDRYVSVFVYNYIPLARSDQGVRNCGMFWEPGAFQGYLILIPLMYISRLKDFYRENRRMSIVLIVALLTTFSTTGYVAFFTLITLISLQYSHNKIVKVVSVVLLCLGSFYAFNKFDFLGDKINGELNSARDIASGEISWTRMGSAQIDWMNIQRHPLVGNGFVMEQKYPGLGELMNGAGNGFTGSVNTFGIPLMLIFLIFVYRKVPSSSKYERFVFLLVYVLILNGEYFLNYPLFWGLPFIIYPALAYKKTI